MSIKQSISRRSKEAMRELRARMQAMESAGKTRKKIALELGLTPAQVTRGLGARRVYGWRRLARPA